MTPAPVEPCPDCGHLHVVERGPAHGQASCAAHRKRRDDNGQKIPCGKSPVPGADKCHMHGYGTNATAARANAERNVTRQRAELEVARDLDRVGVELEDMPLPDVALQMVRVWRGTEAFLRLRVQELDQLLAGPDGNDIVAVLGGGKAGNPMEIAAGPAAIAGRVDPRNFKGERHVLYAMWEDAADRLMRYVKWCRELGVEEARVAIQEEQGRELGDVLRGTVDALLSIVLELATALGLTGFEGPLRVVWAERVPAIVRGQIQLVTSAEREP